MKSIFIIVKEESDGHSNVIEAYESENDAKQAMSYFEDTEAIEAKEERWHLPVYYCVKKIPLYDNF